MLLSKCLICGTKNARFIKDQEQKGTLNSQRLKTPLSKIPLLGDTLNGIPWELENEWNSQTIFIRWRHIYAWNAFKTAWICL